MEKDELKFGDEIEATSTYSDNNKRKFIFMNWGGNGLAGYARVATIQINGDIFDSQGNITKGFGLESERYIHKSKIKKLL